jgi:hypothetical protein
MDRDPIKKTVNPFFGGRYHFPSRSDGIIEGLCEKLEENAGRFDRLLSIIHKEEYGRIRRTEISTEHNAVRGNIELLSDIGRDRITISLGCSYLVGDEEYAGYKRIVRRT